MAFEKLASLIPPRRVERAAVIGISIFTSNTPGRIHLLYLFSKGDQADLSPQQKQIIGTLSQEIRKEHQ
jgi:hypothetical protein